MKFNKEKIIDSLNKLSNQRHLNAIRNGMSTIIPVVVIGSFFTLILSIPIDGWKKFIAPFATKLSVPLTFTVNFMSIYVAFAIAYYLAGEYKKVDRLSAGVLSVLGFLIATVTPTTITDTMTKATKLAAGDYLPVSSFGASGLFTAIVMGLFSVEVMRFFVDRNWVIKLPKGVPPAVINSFISLIPGIVIILTSWVIKVGLNFDINTALTWVFSPIGQFGKDNLASVIVPILLISIVWQFGIHGMIIATPILFPYWYGNLDQNIQALKVGKAIPHFMTEQFFQWFVWIGGCGTVLALTILMAFIGKSEFSKALGRISLGPLIFNIAEPIIYGVPVLFNPIFTIPFIAAPLADGVLAWFVMGVLHWVNYPIAAPPWVLPAPIGAYLATGFDWRAIVLSFACLALAIVIWYPFFKVFDRRQVKIEKEAKNNDEKQQVVPDN